LSEVTLENVDRMLFAQGEAEQLMDMVAELQ
jgi:hypothetical protein